MSLEHNNGEDKPPVKLSIQGVANSDDDFDRRTSRSDRLSFLGLTDRALNANEVSTDKCGVVDASLKHDDATTNKESEHVPGNTPHAAGGVLAAKGLINHDRGVSEYSCGSKGGIVENIPRGISQEKEAHGHKEEDEQTENEKSTTPTTDGSETQHFPDLEKAPTARVISSNDICAINDAALSRVASAIHNPNGVIANDDDSIYPEGGTRAYLVVLGSFCGMTASFGVLNSVGTFQAYLSTHQLAHESTSAIGWIFSIYAFLTFFCGVQIGPVFDVKGPRWLVGGGSVCIFAGLMGVAESTKLWHFILTYGILLGIGTSLIFTPAIGAVAHFFSRRRAAMVGLASTGGSFSGVIIPLMLQRLFPTVGYKWAVRILAFIFLSLLCVANTLIRSNPKIRPAKDIKSNLWPDFRIFRDKVFSLTTAGVFMIEWALFIPLSYISSYALAHAVDPTFSYQLLAILNAGSFFGRWAPGYIADRFGRFNTMIATVALCLLSTLTLWLTCTPESGPGGLAQLIVYVLIFGFASGSNISLTPVCVGQLCGTEVFGRYYAGLYTVVSFGCLTGIPIAGEVLSSGGGRYEGLIGFVGACYGLGLGCFVWARLMTVGWGWRKIY